MANIRTDVPYTISNGSEVSFAAPCNCNAVTGLKVYYPGGSKVFTFKDAHGTDLAGINNLFAKGAVVKAILDVSNGHAYLQNPDTNGYLERQFRYLEELIYNTSSPWNLLDNSDFSQIVNQRGENSYVQSGYGFDRWVSLRTTLSAQIVFDEDANTNVLQLANKAPELSVFGQRISPELSQKMCGKAYTFAVCLSNGQIIVCSGLCSDLDITGSENVRQFSASGSGGLHSIEVIKVAETQGFTARIINAAQGVVNLRWAALYEGEYTAETLPAYRPKGYMAELDECRRYYQKFGNSFKNGVITTGGTMLRLGIPLAVPMRLNKPTMTIINASGLRTVNGSNAEPTITTSTISIYPDGAALVDLTVSEIIDVTTNKPIAVTNNTPIAMYFSAELSAEL